MSYQLDSVRFGCLSTNARFRRGIGGLVAVTMWLFFQAISARAAEAPLADVHLHFNWDQKELITATEAIRRLQRNNIRLAVVMGTPSDTALELREAGGGWVLPMFSPYIDVHSRHNWFADERVLERARDALASGHYAGIGETHLLPGIGPRRDNPIFEGLLRLAGEFDVPIIVHTEASSYAYFLPVCQKFPQVKIQWAHAGGILEPAQVDRLLASCDNVWAELSARDPWHYGGLVEDGHLKPAWLEVLKRYPDRFMLGSDPVWNAHQVDRWYEADSGWDHVDQLWRFHRQWLQDLPPSLADSIRLKNAQRFYGVEGR